MAEIGGVQFATATANLNAKAKESLAKFAGIAASSTDVAGFGSSTPIGDEATKDGRARNRRAEIFVTGGLLGD